MSNAPGAPTGTHSVVPYLICRDAKAAIDFYVGSMGAVQVSSMLAPDGSVMHAELGFGDSLVYLSGESVEQGSLAPQTVGGSPVVIHLYVADTDAAVARAVAGGAQVLMPPTDMFWGDRFAKIVDPIGHVWSIATHTEDVSPQEMQARVDAWFSSAQG